MVEGLVQGVRVATGQIPMLLLKAPLPQLVSGHLLHGDIYASLAELGMDLLDQFSSSSLPDSEEH